MMFRDTRPAGHTNPTEPSVVRALAAFAMSGVSANVLMDELVYQDYLERRRLRAATERVGEAFAGNREALLGALARG